MLVLAIFFGILVVGCLVAAMQPRRVLVISRVDPASLSKQERAKIDSTMPAMFGFTALCCAVVAGSLWYMHSARSEAAPIEEARQQERLEKAKQYSVGGSYMPDSAARKELED